MQYCSILLLFISCSALAVDTIEPEVTGNRISWQSVDARTINIHRSGGAYVTTLPGNSTAWNAPGPGDYYFVGTDTGQWQGWSRSESVTIEAVSSVSKVRDYRARIYAETIIELFWNEPESGSAVYQVYRDGVLLRTTANTNYYDDSLSADTRYSYSVIPVNRDSVTGPASTLILRTEGIDDPSNPTQDPPIETDNRLPARVQDLRGKVYSETALELFWNRGTDPDGFITGYDVYRDGNLVQRVEGTSFFDQNLVPSRSYRYKIIAIDNDGEAGPAAIYYLRTNGDQVEVPDPETVSDPFNARMEIQSDQPPANGTPSVPANLRVDLLSNDWVELNWAPSTDDGEIVEYKLARSDGVVYNIRGDQTHSASGSQAEIDKIWETTSFIDCNYTRFSDSLHFCEDNSPEIGETYTYRISAIDDDGNESAQSEPLTVQFYGPQGSPVVPYFNSYLYDTFPFNTDFTTTDSFRDKFELVFNDEFSGTELDTDKWNTSMTWGDTAINGELQYFVDIMGNPDFGYNPFNLTGTELWIEAIVTPAELRSAALDRDFLSGAISSHDKFGMTYGYTEARIKASGSYGALSSFYLFRRWDSGNSPEIDILEYLGENQYGDEDAFQAYHYRDVSYGLTHSSTSMTHSNPSGDLYSDDYHVYGALWEPGLVIWFIDGQEVRRLSGPQIGRQSMNIITYLVTGSGWAPRPSSEDFPMTMKIDYIRAWQRYPYVR